MVQTLCFIVTDIDLVQTGYLELGPLYLRKESRTPGHAFIVMLSYVIGKYISERRRDFNITVEESIRNLLSINCQVISMGAVRYNQIPKPRDLGSGLLKALYGIGRQPFQNVIFA